MVNNLICSVFILNFVWKQIVKNWYIFSVALNHRFWSAATTVTAWCIQKNVSTAALIEEIVWIAYLTTIEQNALILESKHPPLNGLLVNNHCQIIPLRLQINTLSIIFENDWPYRLLNLLIFRLLIIKTNKISFQFYVEDHVEQIDKIQYHWEEKQSWVNKYELLVHFTIFNWIAISIWIRLYHTKPWISGESQ